jgi:hypothetical protein
LPNRTTLVPAGQIPQGRTLAFFEEVKSYDSWYGKNQVHVRHDDPRSRVNNLQNREVQFSPRLTEILRVMEITEALPVMTVEVDGGTFPITTDAKGHHLLDARANHSTKLGMFRAFTTPNRAQRHLNGRLVHLLSVASLAGAIASAYSVATGNASSAAYVVSYLVCAMILGAAGFCCKMER